LPKDKSVDAPHTGVSDRGVDIVDDDESVRRALWRLLNSVGVESRTYGSARSYLDSADWESADCLLLDLHLPEMSGIELVEHLRGVAPNLHVICMTGRDEPEVGQRLAAAGISGCLRKPFDQAELFAALASVMAGSEFLT
jgi:FixJ family two-component response regulator